MIEHMNIWVAIDRLASAHGLSPSGLAKRAGLDPTSFNPSKRTGPGGKLRWPTTESIAKILAATGSQFSEFVALVERKDFKPANPQELARMHVGNPRRVPLMGLAEATGASFDTHGFPAGDAWDEVEIPSLEDPHAYGLELKDDALAPLYRAEDVLIVSPQAAIRKGDRVVMKLPDQPLRMMEVIKRTATRLDVKPVLGGAEETHGHKDLSWVARIMWVSQ